MNNDLYGRVVIDKTDLEYKTIQELENYIDTIVLVHLKQDLMKCIRQFKRA